jgi:DNA-binding CsgD family transcriptional regulator
LVAAVREGASRALVLRGEAGVGKSALLEHAVAAASDMMVLRAGGVESEMELAFASLHQLCAPVLDRLDRLPYPQRDALCIVFGLTGGPAPDRFLVGLAVLGLLSEVAEERPLLCAVDDAQWLDRASARTLGFVARRVRAEPVGLLFGARELGDAWSGLDELEVGGLRPADARALLASVVRFTLDERVGDRIVAETRGNPLALLELPRGLSAAQLAGGFGLLDASSLPGRVEASYRTRLAELPAETARLLTVAAAESVGDPLVVWRAAARLGIDVGAAAAAETEDLLSIDERVVFRHPLVRSAVYRSAPAEERRAAHVALAEVMDVGVDPDRRAWHLAAAALGPDEAVAAELEASAGRAQARGGLSAAAAFLARSVALTADPGRRGDRALAAADASLRAGALDDALALLATAESDPLDAFQVVRVELLRAEAVFARSRGGDGASLLLHAARGLEGFDPRLARETYLDAWSAALFAGALAGEGASMLEVSRAARVAVRPVGPPRASDALLDAFALLFTEGRAAGVPALTHAARAFTAVGAAEPDEVLRWGWLATAAAATCWDFDTCLAAAARGVQTARDTGALAVLAVSVNVLTQAVTLAGDLAQAELLVAEADAVTEATGTRVAPYGALVLAGYRGTDSFTLIDDVLAESQAGGQGTAVQYARWSRSILLNGLGRFDEALVAAREAADDTPELFVSTWALSELVEAAAHAGDTVVANEALSRLGARAAPLTDDWAIGLHARAAAQLAEPDEARRLYELAIAALSRTRLRPEVARTLLLQGEHLRRSGQRSSARDPLRAAHAEFTTMSMDGFADRARRELVATGERVRRRETPDHSETLTAQELQIATLARDGLSNPEIGSRLFLSPRTVEWHMRKVFAKLDITSRRALHDVLPAEEPVA